MNPQTGTVTFLLTDIEGSTRMWEQAPEQMRQAQARHLEIITGLVTSNNGKLEQEMGEGDSTFSWFAFAPDAVAAITAIQLALRAETWPTPSVLRVRAALHTGAPELGAAERYNATTINRCARLRSIAHGGQTLLSQTTCDLAQDALPPGVSLKDCGHHRLKDLQRPERVFELLHSGLPADFPPLLSLESRPNNLPQQMTSFIGREREMAEVRRLLTNGRLLTVTGSGGAGKTRLALQVAADVLDDYPDGVWIAELAALTDPSLVAQVVAEAIGAKEEPGRALIDTVAERLASKTALLLLDNCEHLMQACVQLAHRLLRSCPRLRILATSREALGVAGERVWRIPSLLLPDDETPRSVKAVTGYEAVRLFIERAASMQPAFAVTGHNASALMQVCRLLDGIPLAIELAAARVKVLTVEQIATRLDDPFRLLTGGSRTALPRQQTLKALVDWSYDLLTEPERMLLRRLSIFAGGWTLEAAEAICCETEEDRWEVLDHLTRLVDASLVNVEDHEGESRYRLLGTIRQYSRDLLTKAGELGTLQERHQEYYRQLAEDAKPHLRGPEQETWLGRLEIDHDNIRAALDSLLIGGNADDAARMAVALVQFWEMRGRFRIGRDALLRCLAREHEISDALGVACVFRALGWFAYLQGDFAQAEEKTLRALNLNREAGCQKGESDVLNDLAVFAHAQNRIPEAREAYEQSIAIIRTLGARDELAARLSNLGMLQTTQGEYADARKNLEDAFTIFKSLSNTRSMMACLCNLGDLALKTEDWAGAQAYCEHSLRLSRKLNDRPGIAISLAALASAALGLGNLASAEALIREALAICSETRLLRLIPDLLDIRARSRTASGDLPGGATSHAAAERLRELFRTPREEEEEHYLLADVKSILRETLGEEIVCAVVQDSGCRAAELQGDEMIHEDVIIAERTMVGEAVLA